MPQETSHKDHVGDRVNIALSTKGQAALAALVASSAVGKTQLVNRALQVLQLIEDYTKDGGVLAVVAPDGKLTMIHIV